MRSNFLLPTQQQTSQGIPIRIERATWIPRGARG